MRRRAGGQAVPVCWDRALAYSGKKLLDRLSDFNLNQPLYQPVAVWVAGAGSGMGAGQGQFALAGDQSGGIQTFKTETLLQQMNTQFGNMGADI